MSTREVTMCDRCGKEISYIDARIRIKRPFERLGRHQDLCWSCKREFDELYDAWWRQKQ